MLLTSCSTVRVETEGLCLGLEEPIDGLADALIADIKRTPEPVVIAGTRVIKGYDAGCGGL
jgi:hypothetical protein